MPQIYHRSFNTLSKVSLFGGVLILAGLALGAWLFARSSYLTNVGITREQPVPFSHEHHVKGLGIDCRYCHTSVESAAFAGLPPTRTCMNCHTQIWAGSPVLAPVRESLRTDTSLEWSRIHRLADFVYFDHSIHVAKGVGCASCHGEVDRMPLMWQHGSLLMEWCLECHRDPAPHLRPRREVFNMAWKASDETDADGEPRTQLAVGRELMKMYQVRGADSLTSCSTCHR